jgi:hypothetical protein
MGAGGGLAGRDHAVRSVHRNFFTMIKERGVAVAVAQVAFIIPTAFLVGGALNWVLRTLGVSL